MALFSSLILLGASLVPFFLLAALIRGGWRAHKDRVHVKRIAKRFE